MPEAQALLTWSGYPLAGEITYRNGVTQGSIWAEAVSEPLLTTLPVTGSGRPAVARIGSLDGPPFLTWGPQGWEALQASCAQAAQAGLDLLLVPHAEDVLSDVQRCLKLLGEWADRGIGLLVDPAALLTEAMHDRAADHLARIAQALIPAHGVRGVVISSATAGGQRLPASVFGVVGEATIQAGLPLVRTTEASDELLQVYGMVSTHTS